jgi:enoyl-CoA hydratase/carnithine racemase
MSADNLVLTQRHGAVLVVTFNRPERLNAWTSALEDQYFAVLDAADADPHVRAIVITGAGKGFCAGADMDDLGNVSRGTQGIDRPRPRYTPALINTPLIAAINGATAGLGLIEALYCDLRFCTPEAKITTAFARRGLIAEYGLSWLLPQLVGPSRAADLLLSGRVITGEMAHRYGLVDELVAAEDLLDAAVAYATDLARFSSPTSMAEMKQQLRDALGFAQMIAASEQSEAITRVAITRDDFAEGIASYVEKRDPNFAPYTGKLVP